MEGRPNNGAAPNCTLDDCLQCYEDESGPLFKQFGGRTRRNSGLLTTIGVRDCNVHVDLDQTKDYFEVLELPENSPTLAPSMSTSMTGSTFSLSYPGIAYMYYVGCFIMML